MKNMKRVLAGLLLSGLCLMMGACKQAEIQEAEPAPTVRVALSAWRYEQGYAPAEGWEYETVLSDPAQLEELNGLMSAVSFQVTEKDFELGQGYRLTFLDAQGSVTREELILSAHEGSREGMMFELSGAEALHQWLENLKLSEQTAD